MTEGEVLDWKGKAGIEQNDNRDFGNVPAKASLRIPSDPPPPRARVSLQRRS